MELVKYASRPANWDEAIADFDSKTLFHESIWHNHLMDIHPASKILYFTVHENDKVLGYFCGQVIKKIIFNIMGSPLGGTGTNYMGPVINKGIDLPALVEAIDRMCHKERIHHIELSNDVFSSDIMIEAGFSEISRVTHMLNLEGDEEQAFMSLKSNCRNRIKKAIKNELVVEKAVDSEIVDHFFEQFKEVYGKQGMTVPFQKDRVASLFSNLQASDKILPLVVKQDDTILATGLFPYDNHAIYFWGATSWLKYQKLCPNEALHWEVIKFAVNNRIPKYNMCGGGSRFKNKFGGSDVSFPLYIKSYVGILKSARNIYRKMHFIQLRVKNLFTKNKYEQKKRIG